MNIQQPIGILAESHIEAGRAVRFSGNYLDYEKIAIELSRGGTDTLVWTLHGTPLALPEPDDGLTAADKFFSAQISTRKIRIIVFERRRDLVWYMKARRWADNTPPTWPWLPTLLWKQKRLENAAKRVAAFETAARQGGKLLYTATDILDRNSDYNYSKLDLGYVSADGRKVYCFHSPLALRPNHASLKIDREEKILIFELSDTSHPDIHARRYYNAMYWDVIQDDEPALFFRKLDDLLAHVRITWGYRRLYEKLASLIRTGMRVGLQRLPWYLQFVVLAIAVYILFRLYTDIPNAVMQSLQTIGDFLGGLGDDPAEASQAPINPASPP